MSLLSLCFWIRMTLIYLCGDESLRGSGGSGVYFIASSLDTDQFGSPFSYLVGSGRSLKYLPVLPMDLKV